MGKVILLNGASSAGKTSIAKCLQNLIEEPFFHLNVDLILDMAPPKLKAIDPALDDIAQKGFYWVTNTIGNAKYLESKTGEYGHKLVRAIYIFIKEIIDSNVNLIIDDVFFSTERVKTYLELINHNNVVLIGVYCSLQQLEYREAMRKDRRIGEARGQYQTVHNCVAYDFTVDTTNQTPLECAQKIATFLKGAESSNVFTQLRNEYNSQ